MVSIGSLLHEIRKADERRPGSPLTGIIMISDFLTGADGGITDELLDRVTVDNLLKAGAVVSGAFMAIETLRAAGRKLGEELGDSIITEVKQ